MCRFLLLLILATGCSEPVDPESTGTTTGQDRSDAGHPGFTTVMKLPAEQLDNVVHVHPQVISGGMPDGDAAFAELKALGVRTVISVDGATPDVETARRYGLRYVHLPHGYDGIPQQRAGELAKAVRELEGPVYIHCHHGRHRSPAAASVACVTAGLIDPSQAVGILKLAGTSPNYRGLYRSAEQARPLETSLLEQLPVEFPERAPVPPIAKAMVALEQTHDRLDQIAAAGWRTPPSHPDLDPAHEALLLREHFTELLRTEQVQPRPEGFKELLRDSEQTTRKLETALRNLPAGSGTSTPPQTLESLADRITANCKDCHRMYRDVPLDR